MTNKKKRIFHSLEFKAEALKLAENGDNRNVKTISASMKRQDLPPKTARKFKSTTNSKHKMPVAPNLLAQDFNATAPNQKWAGYIWRSLLIFTHVRWSAGLWIQE